jgi:hypothetical protein
LFVASLVSLTFAGCQKNDDNDDPVNAKKEEVGKKILPVPSELAPPKDQQDAQKETKVASEIVRGEVVRTLKISYPTVTKLIAIGVIPNQVRAQIVNYKNPTKNLSWEVLELATAPAGDASVQATPFYILNAAMQTNLRIGKKTDVGYVAKSDFKSDLNGEDIKNLEIGGVLLSDNLLDLCAGEFSSVCFFRKIEGKEGFEIYTF